VVKIPVTPKEKWDSVQQYLEYLRHLAGYILLAQEFVAAKDILEIGYGAGYSADYLSHLVLPLTCADASEGDKTTVSQAPDEL
jgi:protein-L-isoaspartate O-methyltransferase